MNHNEKNYLVLSRKFKKMKFKKKIKRKKHKIKIQKMRKFDLIFLIKNKT